MFSFGLVSPPQISQFDKGAPPVASTSSWSPPFCPAAVLQSVAQASRIPLPRSGLQDLSDPASVPKDSMAPLKHEAAYLHRMARRFPWQLDLSICSLSGLESPIVLFLIRVWKIESSPFCLPTPPTFIFNPQVPQPSLLLHGLSPGTFWKMLGKLSDGEVTEYILYCPVLSIGWTLL